MIGLYTSKTSTPLRVSRNTGLMIASASSSLRARIFWMYSTFSASVLGAINSKGGAIVPRNSELFSLFCRMLVFALGAFMRIEGCLTRHSGVLFWAARGVLLLPMYCGGSAAEQT